jgi:site-specific DNA recombinase
MQAEVEYNSCDAQKDRILSYIKSQEDLEFFKEYSDPGFSGGDLERPALKQLLRDIEDKKIDEVLTYKIDRLTRSSKDFYALIEFFEKYGVSYVSVTERFDTSSPSGRLLRNIMLTFAQFEREMTSERIKDKFEQRAIKGMWNGGRAPIGYKKVDKKLVVDKKKSKAVKAIFEEFISTGSLQDTVRFVRKNNILHYVTNSYITISGIFRMLRNPVYIGKVRWNDKIYDGQHEAIISKELFEEAQSLTTTKTRKKRLYKEYFLSKLVKCSECGSSMTNTFTNKKKRRYYYYKCVKVVKEGKSACSIKEVNAEKLEEFLIENISRIAGDKQYIDNLVFRMAHDSPGRGGFELRDESSETLSTRVQQVLINFKNNVQKGSQVEKCLIFQRTIKRINFSKESLEVIVSIVDRKASLPINSLGRQSGSVAGKKREGAVNSDAPACNTQFDIKKWRSDSHSFELALILPQDLLKRKRLGP